jgi:hypothetical protein
MLPYSGPVISDGILALMMRLKRRSETGIKNQWEWLWEAQIGKESLQCAEMGARWGRLMLGEGGCR